MILNFDDENFIVYGDQKIEYGMKKININMTFIIFVKFIINVNKNIKK